MSFAALVTTSHSGIVSVSVSVCRPTYISGIWFTARISGATTSVNITWGETTTRLADPYTIELFYDVMKGTEYFASFKTSVVITEEFNVMVKSGGLIGTTA
jgi:hypothetical protein